MAVLQPVGVEAHYLRSAENIDKVGLDASTLVAAVMRRREEAVVTPQEFKLDETSMSLTRIDVAVDHVGTEQPDSLPSLDTGKRALQTHDLAHDGDDDELNYGGSDSPRGVEHHISSFSAYTYPENLSHTLSLDLPARQPAGYNSTIGSEHDPTSTSLKSAQPTRPPFLTANSQLSQAIDKRSHERVPQLDTAIKVAEREYGAVSDLPPPVPPKSPTRNSHLPRLSSVYSFASSSSTSHSNTKSRQRSARLAATIGHRQTYTMSDPGHGSGAAGPSHLSTPFVPSSTLHLRSVPVQQGARATWAYSEYPPLDAVLEPQARDGPVAFPTTSPHAASFISLGRYPPPRNPESLSFGQDLGRYPASLFGSLSRPRGVSTYSQSSAASHVTFGTLERPRIRKVSNKLRKAPGARRKSSLSISTTLESAMSAQSPSISTAEPRPSQSLSTTCSPYSPLPESRQFIPSSPKRRSLSPQSRQRKKSILSRMFNFHRKKSSAALRKSEKRYTVEPLQLPPPDERVSIQEKPDGECKDGEGALKEWRECWWANKSQSEDGHGYDRRQPATFNMFTLDPSFSASALLCTMATTTTTTAASASATVVGDATKQRTSRHGDKSFHSVHGSWYDSSNDHVAFRTGRQYNQTPVGHVLDNGQGALNNPPSPSTSPRNTEDSDQQEVAVPLASSSSQHHQPQAHRTLDPQPSAVLQPPSRLRPRVLVKRSRLNSFQPTSTAGSRPKMFSQPSSESSTERTSSSHTSHHLPGVMWRGSVASTPSTSPGTSEAHLSSACPPARPQTYFAELQTQMRDSGEFDPSSFDSRYPRFVPGRRDENMNASASAEESSMSTSTLQAQVQSNYLLAAAVSIVPTQTRLGGESSCPTSSRKLTKKRPQVQTDSDRGCNHQRSRSVTFDNATMAAQLPVSPPGLEAKPSARGRTVPQEGEVVGRNAMAKSTSRNRSRLRIQICSPSGGRVSGGMDEQEDERMNYLPQVRPLEPLWVGDGMMPSPYSRYNYSSPTDNFPSPPHTNSTTDALTSLAFTGNTGLLSSSALAALSSRLAYTNGQYNDDPATPSSTFLFSEKDTEIPSFDPYAEEKENQKISRRNHKGSWGGKSREIMYKSSFSFLRIDSAAASDVTHKTSPVGPPIPTNTRQQEKEEELDDLAALPKPIPRIRQTRTRDDSPLRRWTLAMADVSDEVLVQELEKMRMEARVPTRRRRRRANTKSPTTTSSSGGHTFVDSPVYSGESDQKAIVHGGPEEAKWREELVRLGISPAEKKSGEDSGLESEGSQSESCELEGSPLEFNIDDAGWKSARRALLCCRELVRTERSYQARLRQLLAGETDTPPPVLVFSHVLALLHASEALLARLEDDPSAWGVSAAFVGVEEEVEAAFVAWCGVVGALFEGDDPPAERQARRIVRSSKSLSIGRAESGRGGSGKRSISSVSLHQTQPKSIYHKRSTSFLEEDSAEVGSTNGMFTAALGTGLAYNIAPPITTTHCTDEFGVRGQKPDQQLQARGVYANATVSGPLSLSKALKRMTVFSSATTLSASAPASPSSSAPPTMSTSTTKKAKKEKKPAVRELAIQPTQRVMRYVLQYRDLLAHTPTESPSRGLVERALESALRIASKCDHAQGNSTFLRHI